MKQFLQFNFHENNFEKFSDSIWILPIPFNEGEDYRGQELAALSHEAPELFVGLQIVDVELRVADPLQEFHLGGQEVASLQSSGRSPSRSPERLLSKLTLHAGLRGIQETGGQVGTYI